MKWSEVLEDKCLEDLPYKIELNEWGKIVMSPASNSHGMYQLEIGYQLKSQLKSGKAITECSIQTEKGVKVADVAWCSEDFIDRHGLETPFTEAPEICVEIMSPSNHPKEMEEKIALYLSHGTIEVWVVSEEGDVDYYDQQGKMESSGFDVKITL